MSNFKQWVRVAKDSELEVSLEVPAGKIVTGRARIVHPGGRETIIEDNDLQPGPKKFRLSVTPGAYVTRVSLVFADACTATFHARVIKPGGATHGTPFAYSVAGQAGSVKRATVICQMA